MTVADVLLQSLRQAHLYLELKVDLCPKDVFYERLPGSTIESIGAIYAHAVFTEDYHIHRERLGVQPLYESSGWVGGLSFPRTVALNPAWTSDFRPDVALLREYAQHVYLATTSYFSQVGDDELTRSSRKHMAATREGKPAIVQLDVPVWLHFSDDVLLHTSEHTGEIAAQLGARGLKGSYWE